MSYTLPSTASMRFQTASTRAELADLETELDRHPFWCATLMLGRVCSFDELLEIVSDERAFFWRMTTTTNPARFLGYLVHSKVMQDDELSVYFLGPRNESLMAEALDHLAGVIFESNPTTKNVYAALAIPVPASAEDAMLSLGFSGCDSATDFGMKRSFFLERAIYEANHEDFDEP